MKKFGSVEVSFFDTYYKSTANALQFSIEYQGALTYSDIWEAFFQTTDTTVDRHSRIYITFGPKSLSIELSRKPFIFDIRHYSETYHQKNYELTVLKRTFSIDVYHYTMASQTFKIGFSCGYEWALRYLLINIGLFELSVEWLVKPSKVWLKRVRRKFYSRKTKDLKQSGFVKGTDEYKTEMAKALKSHDDEMGNGR